jgi:hypothetical protein
LLGGIFNHRRHLIPPTRKARKGLRSGQSAP